MANMAKVKEYLIRFVRFLGFRRNSEYVKEYLNTTNLRMTISMCLVILGIEIWMIIRQTTKYYIPLVAAGTLQPGFAAFWTYTGNFWLLLSIALSILAFSVCKLYFKNQKARFLLNLVLGIIALGISLMVIYSSSIGRFSNWADEKHIYTNIFTIMVYALGAVYSAGILAYTCLAYFKRLEFRFLCQFIIAVFGIICLVFGVMVSISDFLTTVNVNGQSVLQYKQIICFLTMIVYTACLLVYRPIISFAVLGAVFYGFYALLLSVDSIRPFPEGDQVNYLTFVLMLVVVVSAMYSQRLNDAIKSEELEFKAKYDALTDLHNFDYFVSTIGERMKDPYYPIENKVFLYVDIDDFKSYNDRRGFNKGNELINEIGNRFLRQFGQDNVAHVFADRFAILADAKDFESRIEQVRRDVIDYDPVASVHLKFGCYRYHRRDEDPRRAFDKARYAAGLVHGNDERLYVEYDDELDKASHLTRRIIHSIDQAIEDGSIHPYYQPVVWSKDGTLCGVEALCRWVDSRYGFISPDQFVPVLENAREIHKLDTCIVESVCRDIRHGLDNNLPVVPVSINFSRLDFELMDPVELLEKLVNKYRVPKNFLHVEITESALSENPDTLRKGIARLRELGYALWLDDFGSGYSSFNVLKDFHFDVLKIDMQFLSNFAENKTAGILIDTIVKMCERIGTRTLTEGVETKEEEDFLKSIGCERLQGYRYGKAMPLNELRDKIEKGELIVSDKID